MKRRRLSAADAKLRILDAAEQKLIEVGPLGLRLSELAEELHISHPAILHHFGSREELVREVVKRAMTALNTELLAAFAGELDGFGELRPEALLDRVAHTLSDRGQARLIAWLILSGLEPPELESSLRLSRVADAMHDTRRSRASTHSTPEDTVFLVQLVAFALLGDAMFGERMRKLDGLPSHARASSDFRARLAKLIEAELDGPARPTRAPRKSRR